MHSTVRKDGDPRGGFSFVSLYCVAVLYSTRSHTPSCCTQTLPFPFSSQRHHITSHFTTCPTPPIPTAHCPLPTAHPPLPVGSNPQVPLPTPQHQHAPTCTNTPPTDGGNTHGQYQEAPST